MRLRLKLPGRATSATLRGRCRRRRMGGRGDSRAPSTPAGLLRRQQASRPLITKNLATAGLFARRVGQVVIGSGLVGRFSWLWDSSFYSHSTSPGRHRHGEVTLAVRTASRLHDAEPRTPAWMPLAACDRGVWGASPSAMR